MNVSTTSQPPPRSTIAEFPTAAEKSVATAAQIPSPAATSLKKGDLGRLERVATIG
jgi:hypothetical protein